MIVLILRERGGALREAARVEVADDCDDPETAAWATWTRTGERPAANYSVVRAGQRFAISETTTAVVG